MPASRLTTWESVPTSLDGLLNPGGEPGPGPPAADLEVVPGGGDGKGEQEGQEEEVHQDDEPQIGAGQDAPQAGGVPLEIEQRAEAEAGVGDRLEEIVAVVERARGEAPGQVEEEVSEAGEQPPRVAGPRTGVHGPQRDGDGDPPERGVPDGDDAAHDRLFRGLVEVVPGRPIQPGPRVPLAEVRMGGAQAGVIAPDRLRVRPEG